MNEFLLDAIRGLFTIGAGILPVVLGVALLFKHKLLPDTLVRALPTLMIFFSAFNFAFVGLLLSPRPGKLPGYESLLIAFLFALVGTGLAVGGRSMFSRLSSNRGTKNDSVNDEPSGPDG